MESKISQQPRFGVSLFSAAGIGDIGFRAGGVSFISMAEFEPDRVELAKANFPEAEMFEGDIWETGDQIVKHAKQFIRSRTDGAELFIVTCTAPCQGMSKSGQGTLLKNIRAGKRPQLDPRNRLILPGLRVIKQLCPRFVVFENVSEMRSTMIEDDAGNVRLILDIVKETLGPEYVGQAYDVEMADYGIPQRRRRLITVFTRDPSASALFQSGVPLIPEVTHSQAGRDGRQPWVTVKSALKNFPPLDGVDAASAIHPKIPFHRVPVLDPKKYEWIKHTPAGRSAFDNQCVNPSCRFSGNQGHGTQRNTDGINQARKDTPLYCEKCSALLPRPYTAVNGTKRIMSGYTSAYKRMDAEMPCPALTRNMSFPCSDNKVHPFENRVLSLAEAFAVHSLDLYPYSWEFPGDEKKVAPDTLIRLAIGESIPPRFTELLAEHLASLTSASAARSRDLLPLW